MKALWKFQDIVRFIKSLKPFMKLVVSTGVISSLFFTTACDLEQQTSLLDQDSGEKSFVIGVQTDLLSLDHMSVNALGENKIIDLINPKLIYIGKDKILKSRFGKLMFDGRSLFSTDEKLNKIILNSFRKIKRTPLWSSSFKIFSVKSESVNCNQESLCLDRFISLVGLLRSKEYADYEIESFIKGKSADLKKINESLKAPKKVRIVNFKNYSDAILYLKAEKIDLLIPKHNFIEIDPDLEYVTKKERFLRLSLYKKYTDLLSKGLVKSICDSYELIQKSFSDWRVVVNFCKNKGNIRFKPNDSLKVVSDTKLVTKLFDIIFQNKPVDLKIDYRFFKSFNLTKILKDKKFDLYLTEEIYDESFTSSYSAYHSKGEYNTLGINDKSLDKALDKTKTLKSLSAYYVQQDKIKKIIKSREPILLRFKKPFYEFIYNQNAVGSERLNYFISQ